MLPGWDKGIDNAFNCHVEVEGSEPRDEDVQITGAEITTNVPSEPDENVIELDGNSNEGWNIHANNFGYAEITIYYTNLNDSSDSYTFSVWVCEDVYDLRIDSSTGTDNILPGGTMDLSANMNHYAFEKEEENLPGALDDKVILQWSCEDEENLDNILTFEQDETDQRICHVTVNNNVTDDSDIHFVLRAYEKDDNQENGIAKDEKDNPIELASSEFCVCVRQEYYIVEPQYLETNRLPIGDSVTITPQLYCYNINNPNGEEITQFVYDDEETYPVEYLPEYNTEEGQINVIENQDGSFTVERTGNGEAWLRIKAGHYCNDQEYNFNEYVSSFYYWNSNEYEIWFEDFREDGWTWNFTDEPINYEMRTTEDIEALDPEKIQFSYSYGYWDEENETIVKIAGLDLDEYLKDGTDGVAAGIFIPADKVEEIRNAVIAATNGDSDWLQIRIIVSYNDQEISSYHLGIQLCEPFYDYQYPYYGINMLPDWDNHIDTKFNCYVENGEHPYGEDMEVTITSATIENDPETPKAISLEENEDGSWNIHANYYGHAIITIGYTRLEDGKKDSHSFDVSVNGDVYDLWVESSTGTDNILPGGTMDLTAYMNHYAFGEEEENLPGTLDDKVILRWSYEDEESLNNILTFEQDETKQNLCRINVSNALEEDKDIRLIVRAYEKTEDGKIAKDEENKDIVLAENEFWVRIRQEYYVVEPQILEPNDLSQGESITVTPELYRYMKNQAGKEKVTELRDEDGNRYDVSYRWEYDEKELQVTDNKDGTYEIKSLTDEEIWLNLLAGHYWNDEEHNFNEYTRNFYQLNNNNYEVWFDGLRDDGWTWNYTDEAIQYELNTENLVSLDPDKIEISYNYGYWFEDAEGQGESKGIRPIEYDLSEYLKNGKDGQPAGIFIPQNKVEAIQETLFKATNNESSCLHIEVKVKYDDKVISSRHLGIQICDPIYDYHYPDDNMNMIPGWTNYLPDSFSCYVENGANPHGKDVNVTITNATIENDSDTPNAVSLTSNPEGGWDIEANENGHAKITIKYKNVKESKEESYDINVWVSGDVYEIWTESSTKTDQILPGGTMDLIAYVNRYMYDEEESREHLPGALDDKVILRWSYEDEENISDIFTFTQDQENQNICHIEVGSNIDWDREIRLVVRAYAKDEKGNIAVDDAGQEIELASTDFRLYIRNEYYMVEPKDLETDSLALGDSVTVTPSLKRYYRDSTELEEVTGLVGEDRNYYSVSYFWDYDDEQLKITDNENGSYTITRIGTEGTGLELRAGYSLQDEEIVYASMIYYLDYHAHTLKKVPSKSATATAPGNKEYWYCEECERYFSDAEATKEITLESTVIPATGPTSPENGTGASGNTTPAGTGNTSTVNAVPELSIGTIVYDAKTKANYKVISSGASGNAVEYIKPTGNPTGITISESITVNGISYKVTGVAKNAFKGKKKLTKVIIGKNVVTIGANAFKNCKKLKSITIKSQKFTSKSIAKNAFKGLGKGMTIKVPKNKLKAYKKLFKSKGLGSKVKIK